MNIYMSTKIPKTQQVKIHKYLSLKQRLPGIQKKQENMTYNEGNN